MRLAARFQGTGAPARLQADARALVAAVTPQG